MNFSHQLAKQLTASPELANVRTTADMMQRTVRNAIRERLAYPECALRLQLMHADGTCL